MKKVLAKDKLSLLHMKCCNHYLTWIGEREPNFCPECGLRCRGDFDSPLQRFDPIYRNFNVTAESRIQILEESSASRGATKGQNS